MEKLRQNNRVVIALAIAFLLFALVEFAMWVYAIQTGGQPDISTTHPLSYFIRYLIFIPLLFGVKKLVNEIREKPLSKFFTFFIILYILSAAISLVVSISQQPGMSLFGQLASVSSDVPNSSELYIRSANSFLNFSVTLFLLYFSINFLLPNRGNTRKINLLGIGLFVYIITAVVSNILKASTIDLSKFEAEAMSSIYENSPLIIFYIQRIVYLISALLLALSIIYLALPQKELAFIRRIKAYSVGRVLCVVIIALIPLLYIQLLLCDGNELYQLFPEMLLSIVLIFISIIFACYYHTEGQKSIGKAFEKLAYVQALLFVPYFNMLTTVATIGTWMVGQESLTGHIDTLYFYQIYISTLLLIESVFFTMVSIRLLTESSRKLDRSLGWAWIFAGGIAIIIALQGIVKILDVDFYKLISLMYLPYMAIAIIGYLLLDENREKQISAASLQV